MHNFQYVVNMFHVLIISWWWHKDDRHIENKQTNNKKKQILDACCTQPDDWLSLNQTHFCCRILIVRLFNYLLPINQYYLISALVDTEKKNLRKIDHNDP